MHEVPKWQALQQSRLGAMQPTVTYTRTNCNNCPYTQKLMPTQFTSMGLSLWQGCLCAQDVRAQVHANCSMQQCKWQYKTKLHTFPKALLLQPRATSATMKSIASPICAKQAKLVSF